MSPARLDDITFLRRFSFYTFGEQFSAQASTHCSKADVGLDGQLSMHAIMEPPVHWPAKSNKIRPTFEDWRLFVSKHSEATSVFHT